MNNEGKYTEVTDPKVIKRLYTNKHLTALRAESGTIDKVRFFEDGKTGDWYIEMRTKSMMQAISMLSFLKMVFIKQGLSWDRFVLNVERNVLKVEIYYCHRNSSNEMNVEMYVNNHQVRV